MQSRVDCRGLAPGKQYIYTALCGQAQKYREPEISLVGAMLRLISIATLQG